MSIEQSLRHNKQASRVAIMSLAVFVVAGAVTLILSAWTPSYAAYGTGALLWLGAAVSLFPWLQIWLQGRSYQEALDIEYLKSQQQEGALFEHNELDDFTAEARMRQVDKWGLPVVSILLMALSVGLFFWVKSGLGELTFSEDKQSHIVTAMTQAFLAFLSFVLAKYMAGLSLTNEYRHLRAIAGIMMAGALSLLLSAIGRAFLYNGNPDIDSIMHVVNLVILLAYPIESVLHWVMYLYTVKKDNTRAPFDSRLLFLIVSPESLFSSVREVLDYQFGFKVSDTWFYRTIEKVLAPLLLAQALLLYLLTSVVIIEPDQMGFLERFGKRVSETPMEPGFHIAMPWPIDHVRTVDVKAVRHIMVGLEGLKDENMLWTVEHAENEENFIVASGETSEGEDKAVPVNLIWAPFAVNYRVAENGELAYAYKYKDPEAKLQSLVKQELSHELTTVDFGSVMGPAQLKHAADITARIKTKAAEFGVDVLYGGFINIHPPKDVAESFEKVVGASEKQRATVLQAQSYAFQREKQSIYDGQAIKTAAVATSVEIFERARGDAMRFDAHTKAYEVSPEIFKLQRRLGVLESGLKDIRKYIVPAGYDLVPQLNLEDKLKTDIGDMDLERINEN